MTQSPLEKIRKEITSRQDPQSLRLLCGEMSSNEILTSQALMKWMLRICEKHLSQTPAGTDMKLARDQAISALNRARQSHPDSTSSCALNTAEREILKGFSELNHKEEEAHARVSSSL